MRFCDACNHCRNRVGCADKFDNDFEGCESFEWATCGLCVWYDERFGMCRYANESQKKFTETRCCSDYEGDMS